MRSGPGVVQRVAYIARYASADIEDAAGPPSALPVGHHRRTPPLGPRPPVTGQVHVALHEKVS